MIKLTRQYSATAFLRNGNHNYMLRTPFKIGYPIIPEISNIHKILSDVVLNDDRNQQKLDLMVSKFGIQPDILNSSLKPILLEEEPNKLQGKELFIQQFKYLKYINRQGSKIFDDLKDEWKQEFYDVEYIESSYNQRLRIWRGYEIVNFIKKYSNQSFNPYYYSLLNPWEIIIDKVHKNYPLTPEIYDIDYYDILIMNASTRNNNSLTKKYLEYNPETSQFINQPFKLPAKQSQLLDQRPYKAFYHQFNRHELKWNRRGFRSHILSHLNKIHWITYLTMHYIYEVHDIQHKINIADFDWRHYLNNNKTYYNGNYLGQLFYFKGNNLQKFDDSI